MAPPTSSQSQSKSQQSNHRRAPRAPGVTTLWEEWLLLLLGAGWAFTRIRVVRVSSSSRAIFKANLMASLAVADRRDPDVTVAQELGVSVVENSQEGDTARAHLNAYHLRLASLPGGTHSQKHLGYAVPIGNTLFVYLMGSAAEGNLRTSVNQEDWLNAATEAIRIAVRVLAPALEERLMVHWSEETRVARSDQAAADILKTLRNHDVRLLMREMEYDLKDQAQVVRLLLGMAAAERDSMVDRTTRGKASLLAVHLLPEAKGSTVPWTHETGYRTITDRRGATQTVREDHELMVRPGAETALRAVVRRIILAGEAAITVGKPIPWTNIAIWASRRFGLTSRMPADIKANPDGLPLTELLDPGGALKRLFSPRYVTAWRTGFMPWEMAFPAENGSVRLLTNTSRKNDKGNSIYAGDVECPIPPGGWGVSQEEWKRLEKVLAPRSPLAGRSLGDWSSPFNSSTKWMVEDKDQCWIDSTGTSVSVRARPKDQSHVSLASEPGRLLGGCHALTLYRSISSAMETAVVGLAAGDLSLEAASASTAAETDTEQRRAELADQISKAKAKVNQARLEMEAFESSAKIASEAGNTDDAATYGKMADEKRLALQTAESALGGYDRALVALRTAPTTSREEVSFARIEQVAGGLSYDWKRHTRLPSPLADAVRMLFRGTFQLEPSDDRLQMTWSGTIHVPLVAGGTATIDISGQVPNSAHQCSPHARKEPMDLLKMRLHDDASFIELGEVWGIDGSGAKNSHLHRILMEALMTGRDQRCVPTDLAARILLHTAAPVARAAIWRYLIGEPPKTKWDEHIRTTYTSQVFVFSETWVGRNHTAQRDVMDLLLGLDDATEGLPFLDAAAHLGLTAEQTCAELTYNRRAGKAQQPPPFLTNWTRTSKTPIRDRRIFARDCTNSACPGRGAGAGGRRMREAVVLATHVLWTPETPGGVLCPACRQAPDLPGVVFPSIYLGRWNRIDRSSVAA